MILYRLDIDSAPYVEYESAAPIVEGDGISVGEEITDVEEVHGLYRVQAILHTHSSPILALRQIPEPS